MTQKELKPAVYTTKDMTILYDCGINQINHFVETGYIPKPLPYKLTNARGRKRWLKSKVDSHLGISDLDSTAEIKKLIKQVLLEVIYKL